MKTYHALHDDAMRNGSCYSKNTGASGRVLAIAHFINGDFMGWTNDVPEGLKEYSNKDAKRLLPKCFG